MVLITETRTRFGFGQDEEGTKADMVIFRGIKIPFAVMNGWCVIWYYSSFVETIHDCRRGLTIAGQLLAPAAGEKWSADVNESM